MTNEQFELQKQYEARISIMRALLRQGLITQSEYDKIDTKFLVSTSPYLVACIVKIT